MRTTTARLILEIEFERLVLVTATTIPLVIVSIVLAFTGHPNWCIACSLSAAFGVFLTVVKLKDYRAAKARCERNSFDARPRQR